MRLQEFVSEHRLGRPWVVAHFVIARRLSRLSSHRFSVGWC
jgi:hypothetical protein